MASRTKKEMLEIAKDLGYEDIVRVSNRVSSARRRDEAWHELRLRRLEGIEALYNAGLSYRNIGDLLGLSSQRVIKILYPPQ